MKGKSTVTNRIERQLLSSSLNEYLTPNYGVIIYQEDVIEIIREYTNWDYEKCNSFRKALSLQTITEKQLDELCEFTGLPFIDIISLTNHRKSSCLNILT